MSDFKKKFFNSFCPCTMTSSDPEERYKAGCWNAFIMGLLLLGAIIGYLLNMYAK